GQAETARDRAHLVFRELAERKERARELRRRETEEKVRLVLGGVARPQQARPAVGTARDARVVPGRDEIGAQGAGAAPELVELEVLVAEHARIRRPAAQVLADEDVLHLGAKRVGEI